VGSIPTSLAKFKGANLSTLAVKVERIRSVEPHPNADRLDLVQVLDWRCVAQKGAFKEGDLCVYFPIDSILPQSVEDLIFGPDAKVKLTNHRIKTIKLRGAISQGLVVEPRTLGFGFDLFEGYDLTERLGVKKYEPPASHVPSALNGRKATVKETNPHFFKYTDLENAKNYPGVFVDGEPVFVTEKIHGTNFRAGFVPTNCNTLWKRIKRLLRLLPAVEFVYGSSQVQLQDRINPKTFYDSNVYAEIVRKYSLKDKLKEHMERFGLKSLVVYGEIYGDKIQKNYAYGCAEGEHKLALFDIMIDGRYEDPDAFFDRCDIMGLPAVPILHAGVYDTSYVKSMATGPSNLDPSTKVREGVVVKPVKETTHPMLGRKVLKLISDEYLLKDQTEFH
jgi:RNA ligase (TIGR02306 family)